jgi:hypothetical protein
VIGLTRPRVKAEVGASELDRWVLSRRDVPLAKSSGGAARNRLDKGPIDDRGVGDCETLFVWVDGWRTTGSTSTALALFRMEKSCSYLVGIVVVRDLNPRGTLGWSGRSEQRQQGDEGEL